MELNATNEDLLWELALAAETNLQRLGLFLAVCDQDLLRAQIISQLEKELAAQGIDCVRVSLDQAEPSLYQAVRQGIDSLDSTEQPLMVSVEGIIGLSTEVSADAEKSPFAKFLGYLQWTREAMREFACPIVIWVNGEVYDEIARQAPDFYSWRQGVFFFERQQIENVGKIDVPVNVSGQGQIQDNNEENWGQSLEELLELVAQREASGRYDLSLAQLYELVAEQYQKSLSTYSEAIDTWEKAIALHQKLGSKKRQGWNLISLGNLLVDHSDFREAESRYDQALEIGQDIEDKNLQESSLSGLGGIHCHLGKYEQSIILYQQSLDIAREIGDRRGEAYSLGNLGSVFDKLEEYRQAIIFHQQSLEILRKIGDRLGEARGLGNLASTYDNLGEYRQAIIFHQQSLKLKREIGDLIGEAASLHNLGLSFENLAEYEKAIKLYQHAQKINQSTGHNLFLANNTYRLGVILAKLGNKWEAQQNLQEAKKMYEGMGVKRSVEDCELVLRQLFQIPDAEIVKPLWNPEAPATRTQHKAQSYIAVSTDQPVEVTKPLPSAYRIDLPKPPRPWWQRLWLKFKRAIRKLFGG